MPDNQPKLFLTGATEEDAARYLEQIVWPKGIICPKCHTDKPFIHEADGRKKRRWQCRACQRSFTVMEGTFLRGTHKPLLDWFLLAKIRDEQPPLSISSLADRLQIRRDTVKSMAARLDKAAHDKKQKTILHKIIAGLRA